MRSNNHPQREPRWTAIWWAAIGTAVVLGSPLALAQLLQPSAFRHEIQPAKIVEECRVLKAQEVVRYSFEASAAVDFNVHFHRGDTVNYPVKKDAISKLEGSFTAPSREEFCWMWSNRSSSPVSIRGELRPVE